MKVVEDKESRRRPGSIIARREPSVVQELDIILSTQWRVAGTEIQVDCVNAVVVQDNKVDMCGLRMSAPLSRWMP
jgi:hypothetical protein